MASLKASALSGSCPCWKSDRRAFHSPSPLCVSVSTGVSTVFATPEPNTYVGMKVTRRDLCSCIGLQGCHSIHPGITVISRSLQYLGYLGAYYMGHGHTPEFGLVCLDSQIQVPYKYSLRYFVEIPAS